MEDNATIIKGALDPLLSAVEVVDEQKERLISIERAEEALLNSPGQIDIPITHHLHEVEDVYMRENLYPPNSVVIGHKHKTKHYNILLTGRMRCMNGDKVIEVKAPHIFMSEAGVRKVIFFPEESRIMTVHVTKEKDLLKLEEDIIEKSDTFLKHAAMLEAKKLAALTPGETK